MHPIDARAENSGIDENCPSRITRSTFAGHAKVATLDSESSATTAKAGWPFAVVAEDSESRSTFAGHAKVATLDSESSATTANGHPAFAHSWVSLSAVKPELLRSLGHPCTNQQNQSTILSIMDRSRS